MFDLRDVRGYRGLQTITQALTQQLLGQTPRGAVRSYLQGSLPSLPITVSGGGRRRKEELPSESIHAIEATCCACQRLGVSLGGRQSHLQAIK